MFFDLNVPWTQNIAELERILPFLEELGYNVVALNRTVSGKLPADLTPPPIPPSLQSKSNLHLLRRVTLTLSDPSQNHRLSALSSVYDIVALRPTTEKVLLQACQSLECDLISLDLSQRFPFHFKHKTLSTAISRGLKIEICYAGGLQGGSGTGDGGAGAGSIARRNLISNATGLIRALRGRGVVVSSEARRALECRAPFDVANLVTVWGLGPDKGREAVGREARAVVVQAEMRRRSYKGVVDVVYGGERRVEERGKGSGKRKAVDELDGGEENISEDRKNGKEGSAEPHISNREKKRRERQQQRKYAATTATINSESAAAMDTAK